LVLCTLFFVIITKHQQQSTKHKAQSTKRMSQLGTLIWLKWKLLRNSLRSSKAVVNKLATVLGMLAALALSLIVALSLGGAAYVMTRPGLMSEVIKRSKGEISVAASTEFIFFSMLGFIYLMWATVPLSIGGSKQFHAGKLLMYPITLRKLFAVDFISEFTTLHSVFAVPAVLAISIGAGLGSGNLAIALIGAIPATLFGVALSKWLSTTIGSLLQRRRARAETIVGLIGAAAGLGAALAGQVVPVLFRHAESVRSLRWTPPGAAAVLLAGTPPSRFQYVVAFITLTAYTIVLIVGTYWIARRAALGLGGGRRRKAVADASVASPVYVGWELPLLSSDLSAIVEKELRYAFRNAQVRMMALMPLILIVVRLFNANRMGDLRSSARAGEFVTYLSGLMASGGMLYVFLILGGLSANQFAFEEGGMRTYILSPVDRRKILIGKNIAVTIVALVFSVALLTLNAIVFRDTSAGDVLFVSLSFFVFAAIMSIYGNWVSIRFPKRMVFGKRMNVSGVAGLLLIPMIIVLGAPPFLAALAGYASRSVYISYATLALFTLISVLVYALVINYQGRDLAAREIDILETVREPSDE
jgi:ABC-2 type transport system permease protein